jgi:hypothetical protein
MDSLSEKTCTPCRGGVPPLNREEAQRLHIQAPDWQLLDDALSIERRFSFHNFREALSFVQKVGEIAESEGHHPGHRVRLGLCNDFSTNEEDQRIARERFHHGDQKSTVLSRCNFGAL